MGRGERARDDPRRALVAPSRGAIFWLEMEDEGRHPACVLTRDEAIPHLGSIVVASVSSHIWDIPSEVRLGREDGMPRDCAVSLDNVRTVPKGLLTEPITKLGTEKVDEVCRALERATGCS
jgi:mRNA interferase MazF